METGKKAWIANAEGDAHIDLPGGWHWDVSQKGTGFLSAPGGQLCVGYDIKKETIQFGKNGDTEAPGLNLWTVQEMGEKFARDHFMDEETRNEYDKFAETRLEERRASDKEIRSQMAGVIQLEVLDGQWTAHVDTFRVKELTGIDSEAEISREEGIALFNQMSEKLHVMPLRDPLGYMTLDDNLYNFIKDEYDFQYNDAIENIDNGFINGNGRGCEAVLGKLDATVRKNIREYCLPEGMHYQDLRNMAVTPELEKATKDFVKQRVTKTINFEKKRSHSADSLQKDHQKFLDAGGKLRDEIAAVAFGSMDVSLEDDKGLKQE